MCDDVVWACDTKGSMYMTVSSPHAMATATFSPVWIRVPDTKEQKNIFFVKVCCKRCDGEQFYYFPFQSLLRMTSPFKLFLFMFLTEARVFMVHYV